MSLTTEQQQNVDWIKARMTAVDARIATIIDKADCTSEELDECEQLEGERKTLHAAVRTFERGAAMPDSVRLPTFSRRGAAEPPPGAGTFDSLRAGSAGVLSDNNPRAAGRKAADLFRNIRSTDGGFKSLADFAAAITWGDTQRLNAPQMAVSGGSSSVPSDGGYSIPSSLAWALLDRAMENEIFRPRCVVMNMPTANHAFVDWQDDTHASGAIAGVTATWAAEGDSPSYQVPKLKRVELQADKLFIITSASNELLTDSPEYAGKLDAKMAGAIGWSLDRACLTGTGAGQPLGLLNATSTITVSKETGQAATTLVYENLTKMFSRLHPACVSNSIWVAHPSAIPQLLGLSIAVGTGGSVVPVMSESNGEFRILTRPVLFTEKCATLGTVGDIALFDPMQYVIGLMSNGLRMDRSDHILFRSDEVAFRFILRAAGQPLWSSAFTPVNGSTLSWAVVLQTRS
jgi:HK97 family phage major capsid protein